MPEHEASRTAPAEALPIAPSMGPALATAAIERRVSSVDVRVLFVSVLSICIALAAGLVAQSFTKLIGLITNLAFYGRVSTSFASPAGNHLGLLVIGVPVIGGLVVGAMARYGSKAIRGHGIPEAMEQILFNESRIPARMTFLKPLSAAIAIGTGGPFGAEGPIIATGGALGSLVGQVLKVTADERKTLLCAGAAAGMAATFGSPVSAVLLAIELLLFEYRPRSIIPVALASATATGMRGAFVGFDPVFTMPNIAPPTPAALAAYILLGAVVGVASVGVTRAVYWVEDAFERLPVHWMWWPAIGAVTVGVVGYFAPRTMGVGYDNIQDIISGRLVGTTLALLCALKFVSWSVALGSGTSGGTLAPLFTLGGALGALLGGTASWVVPSLGVDARIAALVGMAAMFAGASHATLASVVFAFETTRQPMGLLPLLGGCTAAYLISCLCMRTSIMTEKIARRGLHIKTEYSVDVLSQALVKDFVTRSVVVLAADDRVGDTREWIASDDKDAGHGAFPVVDASGDLIGVLTRRDVLNRSQHDDTRLDDMIRRAPEVTYEDCSLREAADKMVNGGIGRLPVVARSAPKTVVGIVTLRDLLSAHRRRLDGERLAQPSIKLKRFLPLAMRRGRA
jgi:chloride channel protein, CIC family